MGARARGGGSFGGRSGGVAILLAAVMALTGCDAPGSSNPTSVGHLSTASGTTGGRTASSPAARTPPSSPTSSVTSSTSTRLVHWTGPVEHLFFHTLVVRPELAFTDRAQGQGFRDYFVTVTEFRRILDQLYANGWTLVDLHRAVAGQVMVPPSRKPFVLSEDDVNYYRYEHGRGLANRLVLSHGAVKVEVPDGHGGTAVTDDDVVPLVDEFVAAHPDFSAEGARGVLAPTGYEGLFGERVNEARAPDLAARQARVRALAAALTATGWTFASHSYGHIDFSRSTLATARRDVERWKAEAQPLLGRTDVFVYPFGAEPAGTSPVVSMLRDEGYRILCDIDVGPVLRHVDGVAVMARRHVDGIALRQLHRQLLPLFDTDTVIDRAARP